MVKDCYTTPDGVIVCTKDAFVRNADLTGATLEKTCFSSANLFRAKMDECKGKGARFDHACMWDGAYRNAELPGAFFWDAQVCDCDFSGSNLEGACFVYTDMDNTVFVETNLKDADFGYAKRTYWCDFSNSDMTGAYLTGVDLDEKLLKGVKGLSIPIYCPEEGSFIAWKKCRDGKLVKLLIPEHAERKGSSLHSCRASEAVVLEIFDKYGNETNEAISIRDEEFKYVKGETVYAKEADKEHNGDVGGIYFVLSRAETDCFVEKADDDDDQNG